MKILESIKFGVVLALGYSFYFNAVSADKINREELYYKKCPHRRSSVNKKFCEGLEPGLYCSPEHALEIIICPQGEAVSCPRNKYCSTLNRKLDWNYSCEASFDPIEFCRFKRQGLYCAPPNTGSIYGLWTCPGGKEATVCPEGYHSSQLSPSIASCIPKVKRSSSSNSAPDEEKAVNKKGIKKHKAHILKIQQVTKQTSKKPKNQTVTIGIEKEELINKNSKKQETSTQTIPDSSEVAIAGKNTSIISSKASRSTQSVSSFIAQDTSVMNETGSRQSSDSESSSSDSDSTSSNDNSSSLNKSDEDMTQSHHDGQVKAAGIQQEDDVGGKKIFEAEALDAFEGFNEKQALGSKKQRRAERAAHYFPAAQIYNNLNYEDDHPILSSCFTVHEVNDCTETHFLSCVNPCTPTVAFDKNGNLEIEIVCPGIPTIPISCCGAPTVTSTTLMTTTLPTFTVNTSHDHTRSVTWTSRTLEHKTAKSASFTTPSFLDTITIDCTKWATSTTTDYLRHTTTQTLTSTLLEAFRVTPKYECASYIKITPTKPIDGTTSFTLCDQYTFNLSCASTITPIGGEPVCGQYVPSPAVSSEDSDELFEVNLIHM